MREVTNITITGVSLLEDGTFGIRGFIPTQGATEGDEGSVAPCPNCGTDMCSIRGSKQAVCQQCGFKDSCCF